MKAIGKGLLVILMTIALFGLSTKVKAGTESELNKLLEGRRTVYAGTCHLTKAGLFRNTEAEYTVHRCIVGVYDGEPGEIYYALIMDNQNKPVKLIRINKDADNKQDVLWTKGSTT